MEKEQLVKLVESAQSGDGEALNELFNAFYNDVYYFALKTVKDDNLACDITQEAFVEIINTLGNLKEPAAFVTWMKQITYHQCTRYFKKKKDVIVTEDEDGHTVFDDLKEESAEFIPDEALEQSDFKKTILAILDELSEEQRSATMMYYFDELSVKQIAEIQGVSEGTVKSRLNYARKAIKASVEEYEKKNGIKLHSFGFFPFLHWLLADGASAGMPAGAAASAASSVSAATGASLSVSAASAGVAGAAGAGTAAAAGIGAKIAALPLATKIISGIVAASIVVGGTTAGVLLSGEPSAPADTDVESSSSTIAEVAPDDDYRYTNFESAEDAIWNYVSQFATDYQVPYFDSADEISTDTIVRYTYYFWGGYINDGTEMQKTIKASQLNKLCLEIFGREYDFTTLKGKNGKYLPETDEVEIIGFDLLNKPSVDARVDSGNMIDNGDGTYYQYFCLTAEGYGAIIDGTITIKQDGKNWRFVSYKEGILGSGGPDFVPNDDEITEQVYYVPKGYKYITANGVTLQEGDIMPAASIGDKIITEDYEMRFGSFPEMNDNWEMVWRENSEATWYPVVIDKTKTSYAPLPQHIGGIEFTELSLTYAYCTNLVSAPSLPQTVFSLNRTFYGCSSLKTADISTDRMEHLFETFYECTSMTETPYIPDSVNSMTQVFINCTSLKTVTNLPAELNDLHYTFNSCTALENVPAIPNKVEDMLGTFANCSSLKTVPAIPASVKNMCWTFSCCSSLTGNVVINATLEEGIECNESCEYCAMDDRLCSQCFECYKYGDLFVGTKLPITLSGSCNILPLLAATATDGNVTVG